MVYIRWDESSPGVHRLFLTSPWKATSKANLSSMGLNSLCMDLHQVSALASKGFEMFWVQVKVLQHELQINRALVAIDHLVGKTLQLEPSDWNNVASSFLNSRWLEWDKGELWAQVFSAHISTIYKKKKKKVYYLTMIIIIYMFFFDLF